MQHAKVRVKYSYQRRVENLRRDADGEYQIPQAKAGLLPEAPALAPRELKN
jgi:hypothetical protein